MKPFWRRPMNILVCAWSCHNEEADIGQAQEWMRENLETVNRGEKTASIVIGGASFQLLGSDQDGKCGARTLKITKAE